MLRFGKMPLNRIYSTALWLLYVAGAPLLTAALLVITIPLLLTEVRAGIILLLLPGILTLAPVVGIFRPGNVPREAYGSAIVMAMTRVLVPAIIWAGWYSYFEGDAREGTALALVLIISAAASLVLWAWSVDQALTIAPYLDSETPRPVVARRVEIKPALERDERRAMLSARERRSRIDRAISSTRPPRETGAAPAIVTFPRSVDTADTSSSAPPNGAKWSALALFRRKPRAEQSAEEGSAPSKNGATPDSGSARGDVFTGNRG